MKDFNHAFISYGRADSKAFATKLYDRLINQKYNVWFDQNDIPLAVDFQEQINNGIENAHNFIFIIAPHSVNSPYCLKEIELALKCNKRIIPLLHVEQISRKTWLERNPGGTDEEWKTYQEKGLHSSFPNMHPEIGKINWIYFREGLDDFETSLQGLVKTFKKNENYVNQHTQYLNQGLTWLRHQKAQLYLLKKEELLQAKAWLKTRFKEEQAPCIPTDLHCEFICESIKFINQKKTQIFISYVEEEEQFQEELSKNLRRECITIWSQKRDVQTGESLDAEIKQGIIKADNFICLLSPEFLKSKACQEQIKYALAYNKRIIPLMVREIDVIYLPPKLQNIRFIKFLDCEQEHKYKNDVDKLIRLIEQDSLYYEQYKNLLIQALEWDKKNRPKNLLLRADKFAVTQKWLQEAEEKQLSPTPLHRAFLEASEAINKFYDVFISYGRADSKDFATKLCNRLTQAGLNVWFDQNDIPLGVDFQDQINDGIDKAHNFLFIIAPHSVNSPYCLKEIELALERKKRIIPLLHVEQITKETWLGRNPNGTDEEWQIYQEQGRHSSFPNMHPEIGKINWVYFREESDDFESSLNGLTDLIHRHENYVRLHTELLTKALDWERNKRQSRDLIIAEERQQAQEWLKISFNNEQSPCIPTDLHCEFITESSKNANNWMTQVFLSHSEEDAQVMQKIRRSLRREGITVWTNKTDIQTGEAFQDAINRGIEEADNLVYLLSPDSIQSEYCYQELKYALSLNKRIIPILVRPTDPNLVPHELRALHYIDLTDNLREEDYRLDESQLLNVIGHEARYYKDYKVLLTRALKWKRQNYNASLLLRGYTLNRAEAWFKIAQQRQQNLPLELQEEYISESVEQPPIASLDTFICYSLADSDFVRKLNDTLQIQGKMTWFDQENIALDEDVDKASYQQEIEQGIEYSNNFVFILSPNSYNNSHCIQELEYAAKLNKRIVTVLYREVNIAEIPLELNTLQWIDFHDRETDFYDSFNELIRVLDTDREHVQNHTKWLQRAIEWNEKDKSEDLLLRGNEFVLAQTWLEDAQEQQKQPTPTTLQIDWIETSHQAIVTAQKAEKQRQEELLRLQEERTKEAEERLKVEQKNAKLQKIFSGVVSAAFIIACGLGLFSFSQYQKAAREKIQALSLQAEALFASHQQLESLMTALKAWKALKTSLIGVDKETQNSVLKALAQSSYEIKEYNRLEGHTNEIRAVQFSPDGQILATASFDSTVQIWQLDGTLLHTLKTEQNFLRDVSFSPDGQQLVTASTDGIMKLWKLDGTLLNIIETFQTKIYRIAFSPDGQTLASASQDKTIKLWTLDGELINTLEGHQGQVYAVSFSPDGQTLASASEDKTLKLWNLEGELLNTLQGHQGQVYSVQFRHDGQTLASASQDKTVKLWNLEGELLNTLQGHNDRVYTAAFSRDGQLVITGSWDGTVKIWKADGALIKTLKGHQAIKDLDVNFQGTVAVGMGDGGIKIWKRDSPSISPLEAHHAAIFALAVSDDGDIIATGSWDGTAKLWNSDRTLLTTLKGHQGQINSVDLNNEGNLIITGSQDQTAKIWNSDGTLVKTLEGHEGNIYSVAISPDEQQFATASVDKTIKLWDRDGTLLKTLTGHQSEVWGVTFSPDGKLIASGSWDGTVKLWNLDGTLNNSFKDSGSWIFSVAFSPDGKTIATGHSDNTIKLWSLDGTLLQTLKGHENWVMNVTFSQDGTLLVSSSPDGSIKLWTLEGALLKSLQGHDSRVYDANFGHDGRTLISAGGDNTVIFWDLAQNLDELAARGCNWLRDYLTHNPNVQESDRNLCDGVGEDILSEN